MSIRPASGGYDELRQIVADACFGGNPDFGPAEIAAAVAEYDRTHAKRVQRYNSQIEDDVTLPDSYQLGRYTGGLGGLWWLGLWCLGSDGHYHGDGGHHGSHSGRDHGAGHHTDGGDHAGFDAGGHGGGW